MNTKRFFALCLALVLCLTPLGGGFSLTFAEIAKHVG